MDLHKPGVAEALCFTLAFIVVVIGITVSVISEWIRNRKLRKAKP